MQKERLLGCYSGYMYTTAENRNVDRTTEMARVYLSRPRRPKRVALPQPYATQKKRAQVRRSMNRPARQGCSTSITGMSSNNRTSNPGKPSTCDYNRASTIISEYPRSQPSARDRNRGLTITTVNPLPQPSIDDHNRASTIIREYPQSQLGTHDHKRGPTIITVKPLSQPSIDDHNRAPTIITEYSRSKPSSHDHKRGPTIITVKPLSQPSIDDHNRAPTASISSPTVTAEELPDDISLISWSEVEKVPTDRVPVSDDLKLDLTTLTDDITEEDYIATADITSSHFNSLDRFIETSRNNGVDPAFIAHLEYVGNYYRAKKERLLASKQDQEELRPVEQTVDAEKSSSEISGSKPGKIARIKKYFKSLWCSSSKTD